MLLSILVVAVGGAVGAVARFWLSGFVGHRIGETFPWGTLVVNVTGAAAIGALAAVLPPESRDPPLWWLACGTGFLGGYTTVSSFSLQTMNLMRVRQWSGAGVNILASVLLCLGAAAAAFLAANLAMGS
jgi:fluoride exporter